MKAAKSSQQSVQRTLSAKVLTHTPKEKHIFYASTAQKLVE